MSLSRSMKAAGSHVLVAMIVVCFAGCVGKRSSPTLPVQAAPVSARVIIHADPEQAARLLAEGKVVVLDIRTPAEYQAQRIAGATNLDFRAPDFEQRLGTLDRNASYLLHCASGGRSTRSLPIFEKLGFRSVTHLDGGIRAWIAAGKPTITGDAQ